MQADTVASAPLSLPLPIGLPALARLAFAGGDLEFLRTQLGQYCAASADPGLLMDLSVLNTILGHSEAARHLQLGALSACRLFHRRMEAGSSAPELTALIVMATGDLMANTPVEFLLEGSGMTLEFVFCRPGEAMPAIVPDHDLVFVAVGQSEEHQPTLAALARQLHNWPVPVLNRPEAVARLSRSGTAALLQGCQEMIVPHIVQADRAGVPQAVTAFGGSVLVRPLHSHAGQGLQLIRSLAEASDYLANSADQTFYVSAFVDYSDQSGTFRKYRIAFIDGVAYPSHMAISNHWMIHYLNAGMTEDAAKRAEEAGWMAAFDTDFAGRHRAAFDKLAARVALDYFIIDCGETRDGALLIFEADTAMLVHAMDPPDMFAYKQAPMHKLFRAVQRMCHRQVAAGAGPALSRN